MGSRLAAPALAKGLRDGRYRGRLRVLAGEYRLHWRCAGCAGALRGRIWRVPQASSGRGCAPEHSGSPVRALVRAGLVARSENDNASAGGE